MSRDNFGDVRWTGSSRSGRVPATRARRSDRHRLRPGLLELEDRRLLATFTVTSLADTLTGGVPTTGTLRWAVEQADSATSASTVNFDPTIFATPQTIKLTQGQLELSDTSASEKIEGPAAGVTINGGGKSRVFLVKDGVTASLSGLTITGGQVGIDLGQAGDDGGGLYAESTANLTLSYCAISGNDAFDGGGLYAAASNVLGSTGNLALSGCTISGNSATSNGGGLNNGDLATILTDCTISGNSAEFQGGGLENESTARLIDCTISANSAARYGGGLDNDGTTTLTGCTISGNSAAQFGGGLDNDGTTTLTGCTISGNSTGGRGGGLESYGYGIESILTDCTISGNSAESGGGLDSSSFGSGATAYLTGCTISGNSAEFVGGLDNGSKSKLTLVGCTISANSTDNDAGGLYNGGTATLTDTIVAGNSGPGGASNIGIAPVPGAVGDVVSGSYNLIGVGGSVGLTNGVANNIVQSGLSSPGLAPLGSYGGPTQTMALLLESPAIRMGTPVSSVTTDQRGFPLDPASPDIGAFQTQPGLAVNTTIDGIIAPSGELTLRQAINIANLPAEVESITFDATVFATKKTITLGGYSLVLGNTSGSETITGPTAGVTISGGGKSRVFQVAPRVTAMLSGLTITDGNAGANASGGGLYNQGLTTLMDCTISANSAAGGGGLYNGASSKLSLTDCTISANSADNAGGLNNLGTATLADCTFDGNSASDLGGGPSNGGEGNMTLTDCTISGNSSGVLGGGLVNDNVATLTECTVSGNSSAELGGGLANDGTLILTDTIVAGNTKPSGASDIHNDGDISGQDNLIGTGGSGGLSSGMGQNIVLTNLSDLGLAPLGSYGGPTQTMALLPGSAALGTGTLVVGVSTDQRGIPLIPRSLDIGAFQSQGFTLTLVSGGTPQSATINTAFTNPLAFTLTANNSVEPIVGGVVTFTINPASNGAAATLSGTTETIEAGGVGQVTAMANSTVGSYTIAASPGAGTTADFQLTNLATPTLAVVDAGGIYNGSAFPAAVTVTGADGIAGPSLESVMPTLAYYAGSTATGTPLSGAPNAAGTYIVIASFPGSADYVATRSAPLTFQVDPDTPTLAVVDAGGTYIGSAFPATATVTGASGTAGPSLEGVMPTLAYYAGSTATGTPLPSTPSAPGTYTVIASFPGSADYVATRSAPLTFQVDPDTPTLAVTASTGSAVYGQTVTITVTVTAPGGGTPTGTVTITDDGTLLGTPTLNGSGMATLTTSNLAVGPHAITASYAGDADLVGANSTSAASVSVAQAGSQVVLVPFAVRKHGKIVSLRLEARIEALSSGTAVPTGTVIFEVMKKGKLKVIGTDSLGGGTASISPKPNGVLKQSITILYSGDPDFRPSTSTTTITSGSLIPTDRPMVRISTRD